MKQIFLILVIALMFISQESFSKDKESKEIVTSTSQESNANVTEEVKFKLLYALMTTGRLLPKKKNCDFSTSNNKKRTSISEWIAWNLSFFNSGNANSIDAKCEANDNRQLCHLDFLADSKGDSPWSCGFKFKIDKKFQKIDTSTLECTGSC